MYVMCLSPTFLIECIDSFALSELTFLDIYHVEEIHIGLGNRKILFYLFTYSFWTFETGSDYIAWVGLEFIILLLRPLEC